jgi:hypothetical protein
MVAQANPASGNWHPYPRTCETSAQYASARNINGVLYYFRLTLARH